MDPTLYVILDRAGAGGRDLGELLDAVIAGGARMVQLREKSWPSGRLLPLAERLAARCRQAGVTFVMNDRVDLALAVGADGVHLGQEDLPPRLARPMLRSSMILGVSTHSIEQARRAQAAGADYVAVGPVYATASKADALAPRGLDLVRAVRAVVTCPLVAIGGITPATAAAVLAAGADTVAMIGALVRAADPEATVRETLARLDLRA